MNLSTFHHLNLSTLIAVAAMTAAATVAAEPIRWFNGEWDDTGAPKGKLLSDNTRWWGERIWTGVEYTYETPLNDSCKDYAGGNTNLVGCKLIDSDVPVGWNRPVGMRGRKPIVAVFDFKRPCVFNEVDFISSNTTNAMASLSVSEDGTNWTALAESVCTKTLTRIRPDSPGRGRFLRASFVSKGFPTTWLDEVLVWGDGEVSEKYPEYAKPVVCEWRFPQSIGGNAKTRYSEAKFNEFAAASKTGVEIVALGPRPDSISKPILGRTPESLSLRMARNETEARFFAVVNATHETNDVAIAVEGLGCGVSAELLVGGTILASQNKRKLSEKEKIDLKIKGEVPEEMFDTRYDALPFFGAESKPSEGILSRYVANREQVRGFPSAVPLRPGEAVVMMLRLKTDGAEPGKREGVLTAGAARLPLAVEVVDLMLPDPPTWIYAWGPFTSQFPFEPETRFEHDVKAVVDLGVTQWRISKNGAKCEFAMKMRPGSWFMSRISDGKLFSQVYSGSIKELTDAHRKHLDESAARALARAEEMGIKPGRIVFEMPDEVGGRNATIAGEVALYVKAKHPEVAIFCNPCFWGKNGFADATTMTNRLVSWYNEAIDISVPYRSHLEDKVKREELFTKPRRVNAQYAHPAARAGRSISWSSFRYGLDGYGWWAYHSPTGNPWDIRTWRSLGYEALNALPLENGVAVCPAYEEMREAWEDWRLLTALKEAGKTELLDSLLKEFGDSFDRPNMETARPYKCDFLKLRDKALGAFAK